MKFVILFFLLAFAATGQDNCTFNYQNKKGGHYLFSTYYQSDMQTKMEGVCQQSYNGQLYEKRVFKNGHLIEEELNYIDFKKRIRYVLDNYPNDSIISILTEYQEDGKMKQKWVFYTDRTGRRCQQTIEYFPNGKKRFIKHVGWVKESELDQYSKKNYPPHTIDDDGYTYLSVPIGVEENYHDNGLLLSKVYHKFIVNDYGGDVSKTGPFEQYYDNGQLHIKGQYLNGKANGKFLNYHYTGELSEEKYFSNDIAVGTWKGWHTNGKPWYIEVYDSLARNPFQASSSKFWNDKGILIKDFSVDRDGTGKDKLWYEDGTPMLEEDLKNYQRYEGIRKDWYANGVMKRYYNKSPKADTMVIERYENGKLKMLSTNTIDREVVSTKMSEWYPDGVLKSERIQDYKMASGKITAQNFYPTGILAEYREYEGDQLIEEMYYTNGKKKRSAFYHGGKLEGNFQLFDSLGNVLEDMSYRDGLRHGVCRKYTAKGYMYFSVTYSNGCPVLSAKETIVPQKRTLLDLPMEEQELFRSLSMELYANQFYNMPNRDFIENETIDSTAQAILWLYDEWEASGTELPFPQPTYKTRHPEFILSLPISLHGKLNEGDFSNANTQKLIHVFDSLGWKFPTKWKIEGQSYVATYQNNNLYSLNFVYRVFSYWYTYGQISYSPMTEIDIDYGMKGHRLMAARLSLDPSIGNPCVHAFTVYGYNYEGGIPRFIVYQDSSVEIYNRQKSWQELQLLETNQIHSIGWD